MPTKYSPEASKRRALLTAGISMEQLKSWAPKHFTNLFVKDYSRGKKLNN